MKWTTPHLVAFTAPDPHEILRGDSPVSTPEVHGHGLGLARSTALLLLARAAVLESVLVKAPAPLEHQPLVVISPQGAATIFASGLAVSNINTDRLKAPFSIHVGKNYYNLTWMIDM